MSSLSLWSGTNQLTFRSPLFSLHLFQSIGFTEDDLFNVWAILSVVLLIGNIDFDTKSHQGAHFFNLDVAGPLEEVAELLGCEKADVGSSLATSIMVTGGETIVTKNTAQAAYDARDAMAKALYSRLFSWIVNKVNTMLLPAATVEIKSTIGVLDIFGFESLQVNSLEQLCINIANEQLQCLFNDHVFSWMQHELEQEGIEASRVSYTDNEPLLALFMGQPIGVFNIVDEESRFPGATDKSLIEKLNKNFKASAYFTATKSSTLQFTVVHYAGDIRYDVAGWIAKNRDVLTPSVISILRESSNELVRELFSTSQTKTGGLEVNEGSDRLTERQDNARELIQVLRKSIWSTEDSNGRKRSKTKNIGILGPNRDKRLQHLDSSPSLPLTNTVKKPPFSVSSYFRASLTDLVVKLELTEPSFIRCISPNKKQKPNDYDKEEVLRQLRCTGVLEAVRIRKEGYSSRLLFDEFLQRYHVLTYLIPGDMPSDPRKACEAILALVKVPAGGWQVGYTKVFLRYMCTDALLEVLERVHTAGRHAVAAVRCFLNRRRFQRRLVALRQEAIERKRQEAERKRQEAERKRQEEERKRQEEEARQQAADTERARLLEEERKKQEQLAREERERERQRQVKFELANMEETDDAATTSGHQNKVRTLTNRKWFRALSVSGKAGAAVLGDGPANLQPVIDEVDFTALELNMGTVEELPENCLALCRYKNILPNGPTRVQLDPLMEDGRVVPQSDFVNANWVKDYTGEPKYIATQVGCGFGLAVWWFRDAAAFCLFIFVRPLSRFRRYFPPLFLLRRPHL